MKTPKCPRCDIKMNEKEGQDYHFFGCSNFPKCRWTFDIDDQEYIDNELKRLRSIGHELAELIWGDWEYADKESMYNFLENKTKSGHFGDMEKDELLKTIKLLANLIKKKNENS